MNILFLTQVLPYPLDAGPKVRAYYVLRYLAARHNVTLVSLVRPSDGPQAIAHLEELCNGVVAIPFGRSRLRDGLALGRSLMGDEPFLIARDRVARLYPTLDELMARSRYDMVHADQLWMAPYALAARESAKQAGYSPRLILDQHNAVYLVPQRMAESASNGLLRRSLMGEARRMARYEARVCRQFDRVVTVTAEDGLALSSLYANGNRPEPYPVIPICVEPGPPPGPLPGEPGILFMGGMHWPPNRDGAVWFAREALPRIWAKRPEAHFYAVGKQPPAELRAAPRVTAPGYVANVEDFWARSRLFVVPLRSGGGMRVKILDAWSRGVPVVSTTIGAEGLACRPGENILLADTGEALAEAVLGLLADEGQSQRLAAAGRQTVEQHYDWRKVYAAWDEIYERPAPEAAPVEAGERA